MREKPGHFNSVRDEAIFEAIGKGVSDPTELKRIGERAKIEAIERVGIESEERYVEYMRKYRRIKVRDATPYEDVYDGIDKWETYDKSLKLPDLPVQIKSGWTDSEEFRKDPRYKKRFGIFLVFNVGPSVTQNDFDKQHERELARIAGILKKRRIHFL